MPMHAGSPRTTVADIDRRLNEMRTELLKGLAAPVAPFEGDARDLGALLAQERRAANLSLQDVANVAGLSKGYVWIIEKGLHRNPSVEALFGISIALGLPFLMVAAAALRTFTTQIQQ